MNDDWTKSEDGRSNSSDRYNELVVIVSELIRSEAHSLIGGNIETVAGLILSQLAHKHNVGPLEEKKEIFTEIPELCSWQFKMSIVHQSADAQGERYRVHLRWIDQPDAITHKGFGINALKAFEDAYTKFWQWHIERQKKIRDGGLECLTR